MSATRCGIGRHGCAALLALACVAWPATATPCARAPAKGDTVETADEEALIVWDEAHHVEHFVRRALFDTEAKSFGFIVPTPTRPTLAEASDEVFAELVMLRDSARERRTHWVPRPVGCTMLPFVLYAPPRLVAASRPGVTVLEEARVAGLDATVLAASDVDALSGWLGAHGFEFRPALKRWLAIYVAKKWNLVAFRYERPSLAANLGGATHGIASRVVRITFAADEPFYPYREPDDAPPVAGRELHLFVLTDRRMDGVLADEGSRPWDATLLFSKSVAGANHLAAALPGLELPSQPWVNEFVDHTAKRPATDVVYRPLSPAEVPWIAYVDQTLPVPYELPFVATGLVWWWRRRRAKKGAVRRAGAPEV
jgi:hypothetical protein